MGTSKLKTEPSTPIETETGVLKYQYDQIIKHLLLLQDHAAVRTCPYSPEGEECIRKHLLTIEAYAEETIPIEENPFFREKLENLEAEAKNYRLIQEAVLCGEKTQFPEGLEHWPRKQRKEFESHALICELERPTEAVPQTISDKPIMSKV